MVLTLETDPTTTILNNKIPIQTPIRATQVHGKYSEEKITPSHQGMINEKFISCLHGGMYHGQHQKANITFNLQIKCHQKINFQY